MPDPEPRALRLYVLIATVLVVVGGAAGYLVWWTTHPSAGLRGGVAAPIDLSSRALKPVEFLPQTAPERRERIQSLVEQAVFENPSPPRATPADDELVSLGEEAAPRLLDAFHRLSQGEGFRSRINRDRGAVLDRLLARIRSRLPPAPLPLPRGRGDDLPETIEARAKAWQYWWDALRERQAEAGGG